MSAGTACRLRKSDVLKVYRRLLKAYGRQHWWPADSPFEVMVGAILTQNTAWPNVEKAIANLKRARLLSLKGLTVASHDQVAELIRPSGYFNIKAQRLQAFCRYLLERGGVAVLKREDTHTLRHDLLAVYGVGPETADDMLLYAFERPVFVIDAYTRRIFSRLGLIAGDESYEALRKAFEKALGPDVLVFNEYHALIVRHAKEACSKKPCCEICCLVGICQYLE
jgi:endonuclease-3 related protein